MALESAMDALRSLANVAEPTVPTALNIKVPTVVSGKPGRLLRMSVVRGGTTPGAVHDAETLPGAVAESRIAIIPRTIAIYDVDGRAISDRGSAGRRAGGGCGVHLICFRLDYSCRCPIEKHDFSPIEMSLRTRPERNSTIAPG